MAEQSRFYFYGLERLENISINHFGRSKAYTWDLLYVEENMFDCLSKASELRAINYPYVIRLCKFSLPNSHTILSNRKLEKVFRTWDEEYKLAGTDERK